MFDQYVIVLPNGTRMGPYPAPSEGTVHEWTVVTPRPETRVIETGETNGT